MLFSSNLSKVLQQFFEIAHEIGEGLQLREISRKIGLAPTSVKNYLKKLEGEELVTKKLHPDSGYPQYYPKNDDPEYKYLKSLAILEKLRNETTRKILEEGYEAEIIIVSGLKMKKNSEKLEEIRLIIKGRKNKDETKEISKELFNTPTIIEVYEDEEVMINERIKEIIDGTIIKGAINEGLLRNKEEIIKELFSEKKTSEKNKEGAEEEEVIMEEKELFSKKKPTEKNKNGEAEKIIPKEIEKKVEEEPEDEEGEEAKEPEESSYYSRTLIKLPGE
ncbi:hypothetical protein COU61_02310 [Candidatus Pacearchaeota archaeon CG10_big_fil_rev_8_21_14_0_10_35_13]|nr:MAG: hypothetical protein COU61_02310 [Candidatus Pacearchaeota archaeon CG10_big_fil_rev_8_21_14_0_10_35_13]